MANKVSGFIPNWPVPGHVKSFFTERADGFSEGKFASNNLAEHVGDNPRHVDQNRQQLRNALALPSEPNWLNQVHGNRVHAVTEETETETKNPEADAGYTDLKGEVCVVMTADCLPLLLCDQKGLEIAAVHCGWRSLKKNIISEVLSKFNSDRQNILAYLGPAIGPDVYEVGEEVVKAFYKGRSTVVDYATPVANKKGHYLLNLYAIAKTQLRENGVEQIYGGGLCTFQEHDRFYSFRRDGQTGRMASLIWRTE